jgi:hypothetical protein
MSEGAASKKVSHVTMSVILPVLLADVNSSTIVSFDVKRPTFHRGKEKGMRGSEREISFFLLYQKRGICVRVCMRVRTFCVGGRG